MAQHLLSLGDEAGLLPKCELEVTNCDLKLSACVAFRTCPGVRQG